MAEEFVQVKTLTQFTGNNQEDLSLEFWTEACGPGNGNVTVEDGVLTINWPTIPASGEVVINTGQWVNPRGEILSNEEVQDSYVNLSGLRNVE